MPLRRIEKIGLTASIVAGMVVAPDAISGNSRSMLITFLGLFSASILPTISLLINSMTASGRSVLKINDLNNELKSAIDALLFLFGIIVLAVGALVALAIEPPTWITRIPYVTTEVLPRAGQTIVVGAVTIILLRAGQIPAILRRSLSVRHEIAVLEAKRKLSENAPQSGAMKQAFSTHPDFGKSAFLAENGTKESHS